MENSKRTPSGVIVTALILTLILFGMMGCEIPKYHYSNGLYFDTTDDVMAFVYNYIEPSVGGEEDWQLPNETFESRSGDKIDMCLLMMQLNGDAFGEYGYLALSSDEIACLIDGTYYDPAYNRIVSDPGIFLLIPYQEACSIANGVK